MSELLKEHPFWVAAVMLNLVVSFRLVLGLWLLPKHRKVKVLKKVFWTFAVFFPFSGIFFYAAFYRVPESHRDGGASVNSDAFYGG